jgi:DNA-binding CsgD family transcriptional regulator
MELAGLEPATSWVRSRRSPSCAGLPPRARELEKLTAELASEREERARLAVVAERSRIARELHDVVAHSVSTMVVQADVHARQQLAPAYEMFSAMGAEAFAERARRELLATGEKVRKRDVSTQSELTPQEEHIARLARDRRSSAEIGAEPFVSVRTGEWQLRKVFQKLGISSRKDLKAALPARDRTRS